MMGDGGKTVTMTCMTLKQKFEVENPTVVVLSNGRYAYRAECPWRGKNDRQLFAYKFCSAAAYEKFIERQNGARSAALTLRTHVQYPRALLPGSGCPPRCTSGSRCRSASRTG